MAEAIHTGQAKMPPPSDELFERIAQACYEQSRLHTIEHQLASWPQLSEPARDRWFHIGRAAYAEIAKAGGAQVRKIKP